LASPNRHQGTGYEIPQAGARIIATSVLPGIVIFVFCQTKVIG
jgi:hypothetical protein